MAGALGAAGGARVPVVLACGQHLTRDLLRATLQPAGFLVVGQPATAAAAIAAAPVLGPCLWVVDDELPGGGWAVAEELALAPDTVVVLLQERADEATALAAVHAGMRGCLTYDVDLGRLPKVLRSVLDGELAVPRRVLQRLAGARLPPAPGEPVAVLTPREARVLALVARGGTTRAIATELGLSQGTVRSHVAAALRKLGVDSRDDAVRLFRAAAPAAAQASDGQPAER